MLDFMKESIPLCIQKYLGAPDRRVKNWMFLNSPLWVIGIFITYFATILTLFKFMKNRKPLKLRKLLIAYNTLQVLYSAYICKEICVTAYLAGYKVSCTNIDSRPTKLNMRMATAFWFFYVSKIFDLCDTVFFVLRKKKNQLTFLHIYHHTSMIFNWYIGTLYLPGGQAFFSVMFNSFVHVIMYTYYLLSAIGPTMHKYLWWKKYLTQIQLVQFFMVMCHILLGYKNKCKAPTWLTWFTVTYLWTLVVLFMNFYYKAYKKGKGVPEKACENKTMKKNVSNIDYRGAGDFKYD